jgi:hypothetical protein
MHTTHMQHACVVAIHDALVRISNNIVTGSMVACLLVPCTSRERSCDMVHYNCLDSLTGGQKQTPACCMIAHLYHDLYQGVLGWFCGLASELELAHSGAVHPSNSPMAGPWCLCQ